MCPVIYIFAERGYEMAKLSGIYEIGIWFVTLLAVAAAAIVTVPKCVGIAPYAILSASMEPAIQTGSLIFVDTRDRQVETGDIVTFSMSNGTDEVIVTHRIVGISDEGFITKGDNNENEDFQILTSDRIVGTYATGVPFAGYAVEKMSGRRRGLIVAWLLGMHVFGFVLESVTESRGRESESPKSG